MRRRIVSTVLITTALVAGLLLARTGDGSMVDATAPASAAPTSDDDLRLALDELLRDPVFDGSDVSLVVRDAATGDTLYDRSGDSRMAPASNLKLFTSAAAMDILGPRHRFRTDVLVRGAKPGKVLRGALYLRGGGDPTALARDYRKLADRVADRGIRRVAGGIVTDASRFDDVPLGTGWAWDDEPYYYSAKTSALTVAPDTDYDPGTIILEASPGEATGDPVRLAQTPRTGVVDIRNTATTGASGSENTLSIVRDHGSDVVRVSGSLPADADTSPEWVTVWDPAAYAGDVFRRALRRENVRVDGRVRPGTTPASADRLARHRSMTVGKLMTPFMKLSNNMHAEALVKEIGVETTGAGSWGAGLDGIRSYLDEAGVDTDALRIVDGSGLSRMDDITTGSIADLLLAARDEPWFGSWYDALPIAGNPERFVGGTLRSRMADTPAENNLHGKTGSLTGVSALSGYVTDADGRELVFSMITNDYLDSPRAVEDAVGVTLASWSQEGDNDAVSPRRTAPAEVTPDGVECSWVKAC